MKTFLTTKILGVRVDNFSLAEVREKVEKLVKDGGFHLGVTMNPEILIQARKDKELLEIINKKAAFVTADGIGIVLGGRILGRPFKEKVTGCDLVEPLSWLCLEKKWPLMLMGGQPGVAQKAGENLRKKIPGLKILATSRPFKPLQSTKQKFQLIKQLEKEKPAVVLVALDFGEREKFILQLIKLLSKKNFKRGMVFVGIGGAMDYLAGRVKRAPFCWQKSGLEWLWRLITEPKKRFLRQAKSLPLFGFLVFKEKLFQVLRRKCGNIKENLEEK